MQRNGGGRGESAHKGQCFSFSVISKYLMFLGKLGSHIGRWEEGRGTDIFILSLPTPTPNPSLTHTGCWMALFSAILGGHPSLIYSERLSPF